MGSTLVTLHLVISMASPKVIHVILGCDDMLFSHENVENYGNPYIDHPLLSIIVHYCPLLSTTDYYRS